MPAHGGDAMSYRLTYPEVLAGLAQAEHVLRSHHEAWTADAVQVAAVLLSAANVAPDDYDDFEQDE